MATKKTAKKSAKKSTGAGGGTLVAALVGAAAAGYYLYGPKGAQRREKVKSWSLKAKAEVLEKLEKAKEVSDASYKETVDKVTAKYAKMKPVGEAEAAKLNRELKRHWSAIKKSAQKK